MFYLCPRNRISFGRLGEEENSLLKCFSLLPSPVLTVPCLKREHYNFEDKALPFLTLLSV